MKRLLKSIQEMPDIVKNRQGYGYKYADLPNVLEVVEPILKSNGLIIFQYTGFSEENQFVLLTEIRDISTCAVIANASYPLPRDSKPQEIGAAITYARRYSINTLLGICPEEDTDGVVRQPEIKKPAKTEPKDSKDFCLTIGNVGKKFANKMAHEVGDDELRDYGNWLYKQKQSPESKQWLEKLEAFLGD